MNTPLIDSGLSGRGGPAFEVISDPSIIKDSNVRTFLELWMQERDKNRLPGKDFVDPLRLRFLLGSLSLLEVQPEPLRFRYRLVGTDVVQRLGVELTGRWIDEHPDRVIGPVLVLGATTVYQQAAPVYGRFDTRAMGMDWHLEVVAVPLFGPDGKVAYIGAGQSFPPYKSELPGSGPVS